MVLIKKRTTFSEFEKVKKNVESPGIDPGTSRMLSERSTIWASPPSTERSVFPQYLNKRPLTYNDVMIK